MSNVHNPPTGSATKCTRVFYRTCILPVLYILTPQATR